METAHIQAGRVAVISDAIVDVHIGTDGGHTESLGGAGLNTAVGLARLGARPLLVCPIADDAHGDRIRELLEHERVTLAALPTSHPTGTSRARQVGDSVEYEFSEAVTHRDYRLGGLDLAGEDPVRAIVVNSFPLDDPAQVEALLDVVATSAAALAIDPNTRADLIRDIGAYRAGFERLVRKASLVKVSTEDLEHLYPGTPAQDTAAAIAAVLHRRRPGGVVETHGPGGATVYQKSGPYHQPGAALPGAIVNTVGAGDAFLACLVRDLGTDRWPATDRDWARTLAHATTVAGRVCCSTSSFLPQI